MPITVYLPPQDTGRWVGGRAKRGWRVGRPAARPSAALHAAHAGRRQGYTPIQRYGEEFATTKGGKRRKGVRLLYTGGNHYDLLLK